MDTLLSVLLYIHALPGPGNYPMSYIQQLERQNMPRIIAVESNPSQLRAVMQMEQPIVNSVIIINDTTSGN